MATVRCEKCGASWEDTREDWWNSPCPKCKDKEECGCIVCRMNRKKKEEEEVGIMHTPRYEYSEALKNSPHFKQVLNRKANRGLCICENCMKIEVERLEREHNRKQKENHPKRGQFLTTEERLSNLERKLTSITKQLDQQIVINSEFRDKIEKLEKRKFIGSIPQVQVVPYDYELTDEQKKELERRMREYQKASEELGEDDMSLMQESEDFYNDVHKEEKRKIVLPTNDGEAPYVRKVQKVHKEVPHHSI